MSSNHFYRDLKPFRDFSSLVEDECFAPAPPDWHVILTDIRGSTKAIQEGQYKTVNMLGAAAIACATNVLGGTNFPFVFGGDGATMLLPQKNLEPVLQELLKLKNTSEKDFKLELRVGVVAVSQIYDNGTDLLIGKYELSPGQCIAHFKGGGLTWAESLIKKKSPQARILVSHNNSSAPQLQGLSCRISPIPSTRGSILTLLVKPTNDKNGNQVIKVVLQNLRAILNYEFSEANPIQLSHLRWQWPYSTFWNEAKLNKSFLSTCLRGLVAWALLKFNIKISGFDPQKYKKEIVHNSDFKKFDETLRMVIDCSPDQATQIEVFLQSLLKQGDIYYGVHKATHSLLTCIVKSASDNEHIHFVDGAGGGYALAAVQMKSQIKSKSLQ